MTSPRQVIGYYVHHHGNGHATRFRAIAAASAREILPISERPDLGSGLVLPTDVPLGHLDDPTAGGALHWAPLHPATAAVRMRSLVDWLDRVRPVGVVVDVSVEMALACRLAGFPTVYVRLHGPRRDRAHRLAYSTARGLLAPYPPELEMETSPDVLAATRHVGFIHPSATAAGPGSRSCLDRTRPAPGPTDAVVLWGTGGGHLPAASIDALAGTIDGRVFCAGRQIWEPGSRPHRPNVVELGWVDDVPTLLAHRPLVVSSAGSNCIAAAARAHCALVLVPAPRPFDEQQAQATSLVRAGVAACAPASSDAMAWRSTVGAARTASHRWDRLNPDVDGAQAAAAAIDEWFSS